MWAPFSFRTTDVIFPSKENYTWGRLVKFFRRHSGIHRMPLRNPHPGDHPDLCLVISEKDKDPHHLASTPGVVLVNLVDGVHTMFNREFSAYQMALTISGTAPANDPYLPMSTRTYQRGTFWMNSAFAAIPEVGVCRDMWLLNDRKGAEILAKQVFPEGWAVLLALCQRDLERLRYSPTV